MEEFGNEFLVSNYGRIKRIAREWFSGRQLATRKVIEESIVKQRVITSGYIKTTICYNRIKKSYAPHILVAKHFIDNPLNKPQVNHIDGNKLNNCVENLEWRTASENALHSARVLHPGIYGKAPKDLGKEKADKIREYKREHPDASYSQIAKIFDTTFAKVFGAIKKNTYSY